MMLPTRMSRACSCASSASDISPLAAAAAAGAASSLLLLASTLLVALLLGVLSAPVLIFGTRTNPACISGT
jgi:hypothetical protein